MPRTADLAPMPDDWAPWCTDYDRRRAWEQHLKLTAAMQRENEQLRKHAAKLPRRQYMASATTGERSLLNAAVETFTDFGEEGRKTRIGQHLTIATALTQYARLWNTYGRLHGFRVWQEETELGKQQRLARRRK